MTARGYALLVAIVLGLIGMVGFVPGATHSPPMDAPALLVPQGYGLVLGVFPVNVLECLLYLAFASWGMFAWLRVASAATFARMTTVCFALLAVMGLIEPASTAFGLLPLYGADVLLHAAVAASAAVFGFLRQPSSTRAF